MNMLMMTLMYPDDLLEDAARNSKDGLQNQINNYQRAFIEGIDQNLEPNERLDIVNALPVGVFPMHYRKLFLHGGQHGGRFYELGCVNLPWLKQIGRRIKAKRALLRWARQSEDNRVVLIYTLYLPYMQAIAAVKKRIPDLRACVIVTDLPNELGISSGRRGLLKRVEYAMGNDRIKLCSAFDGFVLLTEQMGDVLPIKDKKMMIIEGLITNHTQDSSDQTEQAVGERPAVLYTGTLNRELGIAELLEAFKDMPEYELWLCGRGDMDTAATEAAKEYDNIRYYGFVPQNEALALQAHASVLINPRTSQRAFTRYSFPSKTLEYMRSGKPVLCYRLDGIPSDYDPYLFYIDKQGADGIRAAVRLLLALPEKELAARGMAARQYVLDNKNPSVQCARMLELLRAL